MATVYEAEHGALGKRVALKQMHAHLAADETCAARFLREGRAASQIRSPHVVEVFDVGLHEGVPYLVMEQLEGVDLAVLLRQRKRLPPSEVVDLIVPVACAIHAAHQAGVVHRDLKPSNIFLVQGESREAAQNGRPSPVILDFGISKFTGAVDNDLTASEVLLGTVHYMSPEQTGGGKRASAASDQYALGVMLYECLTGSKPFAGNTPYAVMHAIVGAKVPPPSALSKGVPPELDDVVLRAMHRDPQRRFGSVRELGAALLPWASAATLSRYAVEFGGTGSRLAVRPRRQRAFTVGALAVVAAAAAGVVVRSHRASGASVDLVPRAARESPAMSTGLPPQEAAPAFEPPVAESAPSATVRLSAPRRATTLAPKNNVSSASRPERGTNGALIVE